MFFVICAHYSADYEPQTICEHLQNLFALLQNSNRRYIDPSGLVKALGLDTGQQQVGQLKMKQVRVPCGSWKSSKCCFLLLLGCSGILQTLPLTSWRHTFKAEGPKSPKCHSTAVLWTVCLCYSVSYFQMQAFITLTLSLMCYNIVISAWFFCVMPDAINVDASLLYLHDFMSWSWTFKDSKTSRSV